MHSPKNASTFWLALAGLVALAIAQGIGRFAFTPLLPVMQNDAGLSLEDGALLASANYLGYLAGALVVTARASQPPVRLLATGLLLVLVSTGLMGLSEHDALWLVWRFLAGLGSAWVLVSTAALCMARLNAAGSGHRTGIVFAGVGVGICSAGLLCLVLATQGMVSKDIWLTLAAVSCAACVLLIPLFKGNTPLARSSVSPGSCPAPPTQAGTRPVSTARVAQPALHSPPVPAQNTLPAGMRFRLILCYALYGLGYIFPATFLPAQARILVQDPSVFGWAWPVFGCAAALSTLFVARIGRRFSRPAIWTWAQCIMAFGIALPAFSDQLWAIMVSALCVGGTFMVITMVGMQLGQQMAGLQPQRLLAGMTAAFAAGQLAGPLLFSAASTLVGASLNQALVFMALVVALATLLLRNTPTALKETRS